MNKPEISQADAMRMIVAACDALTVHGDAMMVQDENHAAQAQEFYNKGAWPIAIVDFAEDFRVSFFLFDGQQRFPLYAFTGSKIENYH